MSKITNIIPVMDYDGLGLYTTLTDFKNKGLQHNFYIQTKLNELAQRFKLTGLPDTMPERDVKNMLMVLGYICVTDKDLPGVYALRAALGGARNAYYRPRIAVIANPHIAIDGVVDEDKSYSANLKIDTECVIVRNDSQYMGVLPLCSRYATLLVENDLSILLAEYLTRAQLLMTANDDIQRDSNMVLTQQLVDGDIAILKKQAIMPSIDGSKPIDVLPNSLHTDALKNLIELEQYLRGSWNLDIGLSGNYNMKREYISSAETELNDDILIPNVENMFDSWTEGFNKVNEMYGDKYGFEISVEWNSVWKNRHELEDKELDVVETEIEQAEAEAEKTEAEAEKLEAEAEAIEGGGNDETENAENSVSDVENNGSDIRGDSSTVSD